MNKPSSNEMVMVPTVPTEEMLDAGAEAYMEAQDYWLKLTGKKPSLGQLLTAAWKAMLAGQTQGKGS